MSATPVTTPATTPVFSNVESEDSVGFQHIPLLTNGSIVQTHIKTVDSSNKTVYVHTQVYNKFEYSVNNAKNLLGTVLAASVLVAGVAKYISKEEEDRADNVKEGAKKVATVSAIAFSAAHLVNAVVANATMNDDDSKYKPKEVPNPWSVKN